MLGMRGSFIERPLQDCSRDIAAFRRTLRGDVHGKLDARVDNEFFDRKASEFRSEQGRINRPRMISIQIALLSGDIFEISLWPSFTATCH